MINAILNAVDLPAEKRQLFESYMHDMEVPAKTILLREGDISRKAFYIIKGCLRVWFNNNGKDITSQFFFEGQGLSSIESFRKNIPSMFTIETVEPCTLQYIHKKDFEEIIATLESNPAYHKIMLDIIFERQLHYMQQFVSFIRDTPTERYVNLVKEQPKVIQRVPQHYIASYLGITPVSLSRIRTKLMKDSKH